jgi:1,4-dihydroxy-2-naphthoyl-CoA hydrolase
LARQTVEERYSEESAQRMIALANQLPGLPQYLGIRLVRFEAGRLWAKADLSDQIATPSGNVHGGAIAAILDHITGAVIYPLIPDGHWGATTELKLNYIAPVRPGVLDAQATVLALTNRSAVVRGEAYLDEVLVAAVQGTISIVAPRPAAG